MRRVPVPGDLGTGRHPHVRRAASRARGSGRAPARGRAGRRSGSAGRRSSSGRPPRRAARTCRRGTRENCAGRSTKPFGIRNFMSLTSSVYGITRWLRPADLDPVRQLVGVRRRSRRGSRPPRRRAAACSRRSGPVYQPTGRCAARPLDRLDRQAHVLALLVLGHLQVVDPAPAVARHLPAGVDHRPRRVRVPLERLADRVDGQRQAVLREDPVHAPEARRGSRTRTSTRCSGSAGRPSAARRRPRAGTTPTAGSPSSGVRSPPSS